MNDVGAGIRPHADGLVFSGPREATGFALLYPSYGLVYRITGAGRRAGDRVGQCQFITGKHAVKRRVSLPIGSMTYTYAMNIHVLDRNDVPVPGATVLVYANDSPKVRGVTRGYSNAPFKLRFNSECPSIMVRVEHPGQEPVQKEFSSTSRDVTIHLMGVKVPTPTNQGTRFVTENWVALGFGIFMLLVLFLTPIFMPATLPGYLATAYPKILLTILALSAAGFAAALTGFVLLEMGKDDSGYKIRAGGALAVFLIVFFWNPAGIGP
jgi:hypothetical protein